MFGNWKDFSKYMKEEFPSIAIGKHTAGKTAQITHENGSMSFVGYADQLSSLIHELSHIVLFTFKYVGIDPIKSNGEPFCYMIDSLYQQCKKLKLPR